MPTYEYECPSCGHQFQLFQSITAKPAKQCPKCGGAVRRLIGSGAGILFKGSGFYQTDYRSKSYQEAAKKEKGKPESSTKTTSCGPSSCKQPDVCFPEKK